jgi:hypothetical protein
MMGSKIEDLKDREFSRLTVEKFVGIENHHAVWQCRCSCNEIVYAYANNLKSGVTQSCGCLRTEIIQENRRIKGKHKADKINQMIQEFKDKYGIDEADWKLILPCLKKMIV